MSEQVNPVSVSVRLAALTDASSIAQLSTELGYPATAEEMFHRLQCVLRDGRYRVFVAQGDDGKLLGWIHAGLFPQLISDHEANIFALVVDANHRRRGIGRLLMTQAAQWALNHGCKVVQLRSNVVRTDAHAFYNKLGFEAVKTSTVFRKCLIASR